MKASYHNLRSRGWPSCLGVPVQTLYDLAELPAAARREGGGRRLRYQREDVEAWLDDPDGCLRYASRTAEAG